MVINKVSVELTDEQYGALAQRIRDLDGDLGFAVNLNTEERRSLQKMGDKSVSFVDKSREYAIERPDLVTDHLKVAELEKDLKLAKQLKSLLSLLNPVLEKISDTYLAAGADAFSWSREFYNFVKAGARAGTPGCDFIAADLKKRYSFRKPIIVEHPEKSSG
jgi:hypothetical protein